MQHMHVTGTYNLRDLGGYRTADNRSTRQHVFIRAGNLDKIPPESERQLTQYGVKTVIDIRDEWEAEHYPNVFAKSTDVSYRNLPLIGDALSNDKSWQSESEQYIQLHDLYIQYLERCKTQIGAIFTALAESESAVVFHCHAGKDRTGIIAALLLSSVDVPDKPVALDYSLSSQQISHLIEEWRAYALQHGRDMVQFEHQAASEPETIFKMLHYLRANYEDVPCYLRACGVTDHLISRLRGRFIEE